LQAALDLSADHIELCDATGRTLGHFLSPAAYTKLIYAWAKTEFTDDEADRAWNAYLRDGGVSTQEAWERVNAKLKAREGAAPLFAPQTGVGAVSTGGGSTPSRTRS
jgi:hypothetical protein